MTEKLNIRCAACGAENEYEREMIVKADDPAMKNSILNGTFFTFECKGCGKLVSASAPILYFDRKNRYMILMTCGRDTKEIDSAAQTLPKEMRLRKVDSLPRLQEMIYGIDAGLEPRFIELLKRAVRTAMNRQRLEVKEVYFSGLDSKGKNGGKRLVFYCVADKPDAPGLNSALPFSYYEKVQELFSNKLTENGTFQKIDEAWADQFSAELFPAVPDEEEEEECHCHHDHDGNGECHCHEDGCNCHGHCDE